ncbi:rubrerythrin family protein [Virgibacillus halodenitrificans]|uniref:ferritin family protein n=1 Tax=Virgibacillus halodenitrificans TaxID=1482 RepID=UPI001F17E99D|nr:ferritin family protein [Virgibacillus halodenitrificans]MCG1027603.1 rubrerythrin family protein [Virgibacillus halodenitrificans]
MDSNDYYNHTNRPSQDASLIEDIQKAINGEYSAISCYGKLAKLAPTEWERKRIQEIQRDEGRHLQIFSSIYMQLTGMQPSHTLMEGCPDDYLAGIDYAFQDEQNTVDFYLGISDRAEDPTIKEKFRRVAADEQNHAVWFMYFMLANYNGKNHTRQIPDFGAKGALNATTLTLPQMLTYALQDEFLAQARYDNILQTFGNVRTFSQIKEAELRHIYALLPLFDMYQISVPENTAQAFVTTPGNLKEAFAAGVDGEIDNISMYDRFLSMELPADVRTVFTQLRNASVNHLAAFERGLARD